MEKKIVRISYDLDLNNPEDLERLQKIEREENVVNGPLRSIAKILGQRVKTKLIKRSEIVKNMDNGSLPLKKQEELRQKCFEPEHLNELRYQGFLLKNPNETVSKDEFHSNVVFNMKNPKKELAEYEKIALEHFGGDID